MTDHVGFLEILIFCWLFAAGPCQSASHPRLSSEKYVGHSMYRVSESVRSTHSRDGAVVLDVRQGQMFNLNAVGSRILELLKSGSSEAEIVLTISHEFNADIEMVRTDVREFLDTLNTHNLLEATVTAGNV